MKAIVMLTAGLALAGCASTPIGESAKFPQLNPLSAPHTSLAYAIEDACIPMLRQNIDIVAAVEHSGMVRTYNRRAGIHLYGMGQVFVQNDGRDGCYVRVARGDVETLRRTVFEALEKHGAKAIVLTDNGPNSRDGAGALYRQEVYCLTGDKPAGMVMSTSPDPRRTRLQVTLINQRPPACTEATRAPGNA